MSLFVIGALTKTYGDTDYQPGVHATVAMIFVFTASFGFGWIPILFLIPAEMSGIWGNFVFPLTLETIGWRLYLINGAWNIVMFAFIAWYWIEVRGRTLEEIDVLIDGNKHSDIPDLELVIRGTVDRRWKDKFAGHKDNMGDTEEDREALPLFFSPPIPTAPTGGYNIKNLKAVTSSAQLGDLEASEARALENDVLPETSTLGRTLSRQSAYILVISRVLGSGIFGMAGPIIRPVGSVGLALSLWVVGAVGRGSWQAHSLPSWLSVWNLRSLARFQLELGRFLVITAPSLLFLRRPRELIVPVEEIKASGELVAALLFERVVGWCVSSPAILIPVITLPLSSEVYSFILKVEGYPGQVIAIATAAGLLWLQYEGPDLKRPFEAWVSAVTVCIALGLALLAPFFPPAKKADSGLFYATYAIVGILI
ncbi:hypothetical protein DHEL01_v211685 [Diaporthe helianthi]|uniref:Uncharacterized protein n=1 Tax=Diaporthe helianthi TaxID=158607 RepID=A0A2P5HI40_DIAHE|nr:hypothetical protein DHEL01_v211685 [Diaporthe helianthi]